MKTKKYFVYLIVLFCIFSCDRFAQSSAPDLYNILIEGKKNAKVSIQYSDWDSDEKKNILVTKEVFLPYLNESSITRDIEIREPSLIVFNTTDSCVNVFFGETSVLIDTTLYFRYKDVIDWNYYREDMKNQIYFPEGAKISMDSLYVLLKLYNYNGFKILQSGETYKVTLPIRTNK